MENSTVNSLTLQLEGLSVSSSSRYPVFLLLLCSFVFILLANAAIVGLILTQRSLRQPMYLLFCSLAANDVMGNALLVPRLLADVLLPPSQRLIHFYECVVQAFATHLFCANSHTVLMVMAFDRYVAICRPLRYASIMTDRRVVQLTAGAWGAGLVLVGVLLGLTLRLNRCRTLIANPYCDNASLFKLSCDDAAVANVYGLAYTGLLLSSSAACIVLTYSKIAAACVSSSSRRLSGWARTTCRARTTCSSHLCVYVLMLLSGLVFVVLHRFPQHAELRKTAAILFHTVPGSLNPVIYGLQSKEIHRCLSKLVPVRRHRHHNQRKSSDL
ncbi:olfactory receptor 4E1-like isoform X2 [Betta splendens]|uniref:Olfactory receptor 4E1-like isoform X2 n=1 Tax=Betta splendens TaxID=158456 RepID=A0A8M1HNF4_BETSP|nr:olfactory receptor 4E1-like isoform X2 [Betta splendens]